MICTDKPNPEAIMVVISVFVSNGRQAVRNNHADWAQTIGILLCDMNYTGQHISCYSHTQTVFKRGLEADNPLVVFLLAGTYSPIDNQRISTKMKSSGINCIIRVNNKKTQVQIEKKGKENSREEIFLWNKVLFVFCWRVKGTKLLLLDCTIQSHSFMIIAITNS